MTINKQALREASENATPGEWCADDMFGVVADAGLNGNFYIATCSGPDNRDNKRFIAAADPATVLALLDELGAAEKRIAELEARTVKLPTGTEVNGFQMLIEEEVIARLRESGVNPIVVRAAGIGVKGE